MEKKWMRVTYSFGVGKLSFFMTLKTVCNWKTCSIFNYWGSSKMWKKYVTGEGRIPPPPTSPDSHLLYVSLHIISKIKSRIERGCQIFQNDDIVRTALHVCVCCVCARAFACMQCQYYTPISFLLYLPFSLSSGSIYLCNGDALWPSIINLGYCSASILILKGILCWHFWKCCP